MLIHRHIFDVFFLSHSMVEQFARADASLQLPLLRQNLLR